MIWLFWPVTGNHLDQLLVLECICTEPGSLIHILLFFTFFSNILFILFFLRFIVVVRIHHHNEA
jgi:hypothetical protein